MVLAMKVISVAYDLQSKILQELPGFCEYCGYVFHVGSVVFGPWISLPEYLILPQPKEFRPVRIILTHLSRDKLIRY